MQDLAGSRRRREPALRARHPRVGPRDEGPARLHGLLVLRRPAIRRVGPVRAGHEGRLSGARRDARRPRRDRLHRPAGQQQVDEDRRDHGLELAARLPPDLARPFARDPLERPRRRRQPLRLPGVRLQDRRPPHAAPAHLRRLARRRVRADARFPAHAAREEHQLRRHSRPLRRANRPGRNRHRENGHEHRPGGVPHQPEANGRNRLPARVQGENEPLLLPRGLEPVRHALHRLSEECRPSRRTPAAGRSRPTARTCGSST